MIKRAFTILHVLTWLEHFRVYYYFLRYKVKCYEKLN